jgi:phosphoglycolate phosphatase
MSNLPSAILFDWDNTLVDTFPMIFEAHNEVRRALGHTLWTEDDARRNIRLAMKDIFPKWYGDRARDAEKIYLDHVRANHLSMMTIIDGTADLMDHIKGRNIPMGVVSNKRGEFLRKEVTQAGWDHYFKVIVGADEINGPGKPAPDGILQALGALGIKPAGTWYVGDTEIDIQAAHGAGAVSVFVENLTMTPLAEIEALSPAMTFKNPRECLAYLKGLV